MAQAQKEQTVDVSDLNFRYPTSPADVLRAIDLHLQPGSRALLCGSNGSGKSTLLQILAGKRMIKTQNAKVLGQNVFFNTPAGLTWLGTEWAQNPVVRSDLYVYDFLDSVGGWRHPERRDALLELMDVDLNWRMHMVSDGERRRVQIVAGLMAPWQVLLLDEVTVDLDVLVRTELLNFLVRETEERGATVVYATHIYDGMDNWPTNVVHMRLGEIKANIEWPLQMQMALPDGVDAETRDKMQDDQRAGSKLMVLALAWLAQDKQYRKTLEAEGKERVRGPSSDTNKASFYAKYDYSH